MDSQIDKCLRTGYVEVNHLGAPTPAIEGRAVTLQGLSKNGSNAPSLSLNEFELFMLLNWLIDIEVFDNHLPLQLEKVDGTVPSKTRLRKASAGATFGVLRRLRRNAWAGR